MPSFFFSLEILSSSICSVLHLPVSSQILFPSPYNFILPAVNISTCTLLTYSYFMCCSILLLHCPPCYIFQLPKCRECTLFTYHQCFQITLYYIRLVVQWTFAQQLLLCIPELEIQNIGQNMMDRSTYNSCVILFCKGKIR